MLKPGWLASETVAGVALSQDGPTGTGSPATDRLVTCKVMVEVVVTAPVFRLTVPVVGPSWRNATVAVTGIRPSSVNDPVAGGRLRLAVTAPVFRSTLDRSVPGPSVTVALAALMNVLPCTGYLTLSVVSADAAAGVAAIVASASSPAMAVAAAPRPGSRTSRFMGVSLIVGRDGVNGDSSVAKMWAATGWCRAVPAVRWLPLRPLAARCARYGEVIFCLGVTV